MPFCLFTCLLFCLTACLSVYLSCLPALLSACLSAWVSCLFVCFPACLSVCLPACLSAFQCSHLSVCARLPVCQPTCLSDWSNETNDNFANFRLFATIGNRLLELGGDRKFFWHNRYTVIDNWRYPDQQTFSSMHIISWTLGSESWNPTLNNWKLLQLVIYCFLSIEMNRFREYS
jgi:hypothetical protein